MPPRFTIHPARTDDDMAEAASLFAAYAASLPLDLGYQDFAAELAALPGKYAPPAGELLLARDSEGTPLGCAALRPIPPEGCCEMKRLFLLPAARGLGLGQAMTERVVAEARQRRYRELRLDTLPGMTTAIALYARLGFRPIPPYYEPTPAGTIFMALAL